jgi:hypothetical protein
MKSISVKSIRTTLLTFLCSCIVQPNPENMFVYAQYTSPPNCGASCYSERARQNDMNWATGSAGYNNALNGSSQGIPPVIPIIVLGGVAFCIYHAVKNSANKDKD